MTKLITIPKFARATGLPYRLCLQLVGTRQIPSVPVGSRRRIDGLSRRRPPTRRRRGLAGHRALPTSRVRSRRFAGHGVAASADTCATRRILEKSERAA
jgi:hypothetical protein